MPETSDVFKRYLDVGLAFTQLTRAKAEELVKEWVKAGEVQRDQAQQRVDDLVERSRKNSEQFLDMIRREVSSQLAGLGLATKDDLAALESRLRSAAASTRPPATTPRPATTPGPAAAPRTAAAAATKARAPRAAAPAAAKAPAGPVSKATRKKAAAKKAGGSTTG